MFRGVFMNTVSERLLYLMDMCDMKQVQLAQSVGISKQSLYKYLHCKCEPRAQIIAKMATVLNTTADYIVGLTNDPSPAHRNPQTELNAKKENELLAKIKRLSPDDRIRIGERIDMMLGE